MKVLKKYFKPKSATWVVGLIMIVSGIVTKDTTQIMEGAGLIGLRGAIND